MRNPVLAVVAMTAFLAPIGVVVWQHRAELGSMPTGPRTIQGELLYFTSPS